MCIEKRQICGKMFSVDRKFNKPFLQFTRSGFKKKSTLGILTSREIKMPEMLLPAHIDN